MQHVCSGLPVASSTLRRLTSNPGACCTSHRGTPCAKLCPPHPQIFVGKKSAAEKYLGSKYLSRSRFLRNIPRVRFWREIFPENIPRETLLAAPKNILPVPPTKYLSKISTVRNSLRIRLTSTAFFFLPSPLLSSHYFSSTPCHPYSRNRSGLI